MNAIFRRTVWLILLLIVGVMPASAQVGGEELPEGVTGDDVYRVSSKLYCDVCEGVPVSACPSPTCAAWRQEIATLLGEGKADQEIMAYFAQNYGDDVTGIPLEGTQRYLALLVPLMVALLLGGMVAWQLGRMRQRGLTRAQSAAQSAGLQSGYQRPVPDNVDPAYLERFLSLLEER